MRFASSTSSAALVYDQWAGEQRNGVNERWWNRYP